MSIKAIILAAGQGTRMCSALPKVLHPLAGKPLLQWVVEAALASGVNDVYVVYGQSEKVKTTPGNIEWVQQAQQLGTGHAVNQAMQKINTDTAEQILVLCGDTPLITPSTLQNLLSNTPKGAIGLLTANVSEPAGLGRIIKSEHGKVVAIIEEKDASEQQKSITEINTGIILLPAKKAKIWLNNLKNDNAQGEYYLTDVVAMAVNENVDVKAIQTNNTVEVSGINTRAQLAQCERSYQMSNVEQLMEQGVSFADPARFDLRGKLECAQDISIDVNVIIEGTVKLAAGVKIGANVILKDVSVGANTEILPNSMIEDSVIGKCCAIGPFARLRPGTKLADNVKVGNFVETKKATIGSGSKLSHLSYIGDAVIGKNVNIGAGTITCNYDGVNKFTTTIEDNVFIGSDSQLIAPVTIGENAYIGAGSSISKNAPANKLTVARARQKTIDNWQAPKK